MMKKMLALAMALLLLWMLPQGAKADAYDSTMNALYRLVLRTEAGDVTLGSGVVFVQQDMLLTAASCCREGNLVAIGQDGEHAVAGYETFAETGVALVQLETPSAAAPLFLSDYEEQVIPYLFGADAMHNLGVMSLYQVLQDVYRNRSALILSGQEGLLPGAVMVDTQGDVMALVMAQKAEGIGMYVSYDPAVIYEEISGSKDASAFLPISLSWDEGVLTISWEDEARDSGLYLITLNGGENAYYTNYEAATDQRSFSLALPLGYTYFFQVQWTQSIEEAHGLVWGAMTQFTPPMAQLTEYDFQQRCYLATAPAGTEVTDALPELTDVYVDVLEDPLLDLYLQIFNTYDVAEDITLPMTLELVAPDGQFYFEETGYIFSPEYEDNDVFAVPVDGLFADCRGFSGNQLLLGEYTLRYTIGGRLAGEVSFLLQEREEKAERDAISGFVPGIQAVEEKGRISVSWDRTLLPEGAKVNVYFLFDGNSFYTYHSMKEDSAGTEILSVPGYGVLIWGTWSTEGEPPRIAPEKPEHFILTHGQARAPLTRNGFTNLRCSVTASSDPNAAQTGAFLPLVPLTRELLSDKNTFLYFQTEDIYQVAEESNDHPLALALITPAGEVFVDQGGYTFAPELAISDLWLKDVTDLFAQCGELSEQPWQSGEYSLLYLIDGQVAGEFNFTLE